MPAPVLIPGTLLPIKNSFFGWQKGSEVNSSLRVHSINLTVLLDQNSFEF